MGTAVSNGISISRGTRYDSEGKGRSFDAHVLHNRHRARAATSKGQMVERGSEEGNGAFETMGTS